MSLLFLFSSRPQNGPASQGNLYKFDDMPEGTDMACLSSINRTNRHPIQMISKLKAAYNHLNFKFKSPFCRFKHQFHQPAADKAVTGLIIGDWLANSPGENLRAERIA